MKFYWWVFAAIVWWLFLLPLLVGTRRKDGIAAIKLKKKNKNRSVRIMTEIIEELIGKNCTVSTVDGKTYDGIVESLKDNWLVIKPDYFYEKQVVNIEYVTGICEIKQKKNTKKVK